MSSGSYRDNDFISAGSSSQSVPEITVIVQSEVEKSKAMKFFSNHFPPYQNRYDKGSVR